METQHKSTPWKYQVNVGPTKGMILEEDGTTVFCVDNNLHRSDFEKNLQLICRSSNVHDELIAALEYYTMYEDMEGEDSIEKFERIGEVFRKETGYLRPGKDCRIDDPETRRIAWEKWQDMHADKAKQALAKAKGAI